MLEKPSDVTASCLTESPCQYVGPTSDWTGPETPLPLTKNPLANLLCELFAAASKHDSEVIKMDLDAGRINTTCESKEDLVILPSQRPDLWTPLVFMLPRLSSIESCQGIVKDPTTEDEWRFNFTKENNQIILSKTDSSETKENL